MAKIRRSPIFQKPQLTNLSVTNSQRKVRLSLHSAKKLVAFLLDQVGYGDMGLHFVSKKQISLMHADHFDDPTPTDCISFSNEDPFFLGEVFVCPEVALEYVSKEGGDLAEETTLYVVHGFLHLLGFDDLSEKDRKKMRREEKKWLQLLAKNKLEITIKT